MDIIDSIIRIFKKGKNCEHRFKITKIEITKEKNTIQTEECEKCGESKVSYF